MSNRREMIRIGILMTVFLVIGLLPTAIQIAHIPPGHDYIPVHNSLSDYPFYTAVIRQGLDGHTTVTNPFITTVHKGGYVEYIYLVIGWIGRLFGIQDAHVMYHSSRIILAAANMAAIYFLVRTVFPGARSRMIAFILIIAAGGFPTIYKNYWGNFTVRPYIPWWSEFEPIARIAFLPHYLAGHSAAALSVSAALRFTKTRKYLWFAVIAVCGWIAGLVHTPSLIIVGAVLPLWFLAIRDIRGLVICTLSLCIAATSIIPLIHSYWGYPWSVSKDYEAIQFNFSLLSYALALGPTVLLSIPVLIIKRKDRIVWLLSLWIVMTFILLPVVRAMAISPVPLIRDLTISDIRIFQMAAWIPAALLATIFLSTIEKKKILLLFTWLFILIPVAVQYPYSVRDQSNNLFGSAKFMYPAKGYLDAIREAGRLTPEGGIVMAMSLVGQIIPSYTGRAVFVGNKPVYSPDVKQYMDKAWAFYAGSMPQCTAYSLLIDHRISSIFYSFDEAQTGGGMRNYPFVKPYGRYGSTELYVFDRSARGGCGI